MPPGNRLQRAALPAAAEPECQAACSDFDICLGGMYSLIGQGRLRLASVGVGGPS